MHKLRAAGSTLIEVVFAIAIIVLLLGIAADRWSAFRERETLTTSVDTVVSLLNEARSRTLDGDAGTQYGVHLASDRAVEFVGATYSSSASTNKTLLLDSSVSLGSISLSGSGSDVVFSRLSGNATGYGTFVISLVSGAGSKTITVNRAGIVTSN